MINKNNREIVKRTPNQHLWSGAFFVFISFIILLFHIISPKILSAFPPQDEGDLINRGLFKKDTTQKSSLLPDYSSRREREGVYKFGRKNPEGYTTKSQLDSSDKSLRNYEQIAGEEIGYDYELSLDAYLNIRKRQIQHTLWDSLVTDYDLKKALSGGDLAKLIASSTGLSIPLPPNAVTSIFGSPKISINVNGEVNVRVGWRWDTQNLGVVSQFGQTQSTPIFSQDIRVNVSGGIGDKLKLSTDWNTRRSFDTDNEFKIGYEGEDDDIIKLIEVGNVSLPSYNSLIGGGQSLFGIRADFQFGPLFLKTILSQKKGERKFVQAKGGQSLVPFSIRAYDYARNHFFIDSSYKKVYKEYFKYSTPITPTGFDHLTVKEIDVWENTSNQTVTQKNRAIAIDNLPLIARGVEYDDSILNREIVTGEVVDADFQLLDSTKWDFDYTLGTLRIENLSPDKYYAVSYRIEGPGFGPEDDLYAGYLSSENTNYLQKDSSASAKRMVLKLIYVPQMVPNYEVIWDRQMKNIYNLSASNIQTDQSKINVYYVRESNDSADVLEGSPDKIVTILGVDRSDKAGQARPDGEFDMREPYFDARRGEITFPSLEPFGEGLEEYFDKLGRRNVADKYTFHDVYDTTYDVARQNTSRDRFVIAGEVAGKSSNRIRLGAYNLAPGSVKVTLDGVQLKEYQDYVVDYISGSVQLRNPRALLPNANIRVEFEQQDIFQVATKTLAGLRADYNLFKKRSIRSDIGFTFMFYNQSAVVDRVQIGQEPVANTMLGFDYRMDWDTPWITKALDALPFYDTKTKSTIDMTAEWAMMIPEPNKRKSEIPSDNGESVVYIDDFEGAQRRITLGLNPSLWSYSSPPVNDPLDSTSKMASLQRGQMFWYQYFVGRERKANIWPNQENIVGQTRISPLEIHFDPRRRGIYNRNDKFLDESNGEFYENQEKKYPDSLSSDGRPMKDRIWGGMQRLLSSFNTNFDTENIEFIEIRMKMTGKEPSTKLYLDLGQISEDVIPNKLLDTEDGITLASPRINGLSDDGEDLGIDAMNNQMEKGEVAQDTLSTEIIREPYPFPLNQENDPARDDYSFDFNKSDDQRTVNDFSNYNKYENNAKQAASGKFPDTEVLNLNNGTAVWLDNSYYRYEINIANLDPESNPQIVGGNPEQGWWQFRIPIRKSTSQVGNPTLSNVQYIRLVAQGGVFDAQIADWALVGSQWLRLSNFQSGVETDDSVMSVAFVNIFDNAQAPDYYSMPPGVRAPQQFNTLNENQDIKLNEQSLSVSVRNLRYGEERMAVRIFYQLDLFNYKKLKFFIHGDGSLPMDVEAGSIPKANVFVRFGTDSSNYYEYRRPLTRGWQDVDINLKFLTEQKLKQVLQNNQNGERKTFTDPNDPVATYSVRGSPILTNVRFFGIGIENPAEQFPNELTTSLWFNELRLIDAKDDADWAALASVNMKLADFGTVNATFNRRQPEFHQLEERFGDRNTQGDFSFTTQGNFDKFLPKSFKRAKIPVTYSHAEYNTNPSLIANSDIEMDLVYKTARTNGLNDSEAQQITDSIRNRAQTLIVQDSWALTGLKFGIPVRHWSVNQTINKVIFSYSYAQEYERNPIYSQKFYWVWDMELAYANKIPDLLTIKPLEVLKDVPILGVYSKWKLNFLPSQIGGNLKMQRGRRTEQSRYLTFASPVLRDFDATRNANFTWKFSQGGLLSPTFDYSFTTRSTLLELEQETSGRQRTGGEIFNEMFFGPKGINWGDNTLHNQNVTISLRPLMPDLWGFSKQMAITGSYSSDYSWNDPLQPEKSIADVAKNAQYGASLRMKMDFKLKRLADGWFGGPNLTGPPDGSMDSSLSQSIFRNIGQTFKFIFLDYDKINFKFNQSTNSTNPAVYGQTGMQNFWTRGLVGRDSDLDYGPSFPYQMGLISNPHGSVGLTSSNAFPYFGFTTSPGLRPPNANFTDSYRQTNKYNISTSRPLWPGAILDIKWETNTAYNLTKQIKTDAQGVQFIKFSNGTETLERSYISLPSVFGADLFGNNVENVVSIFNQSRATLEADPEFQNLDDVGKNRRINEVLSKSFYDGLEAFSFSGSSIGRFLPSLNWGIRWEGIEKWGIWNDYLKKVQVDHSYNSRYSESVNIDDNGRAIQNQQVNTGFQPLIGVTFSFVEDKMDGTLTGSIKWNNTNGYNLNSAAKSTITSQQSNEITTQAAYTLNSFQFKLLGISLENELEFSFTGSYKFNGRGTFDILDVNSFQGGEERGRVLDGSTVIYIEPRIRYSLSKRLTASFFIRYDGTFNEGAANPGFYSTQVGLDVRLSIAGGR